MEVEVVLAFLSPRANHHVELGGGGREEERGASAWGSPLWGEVGPQALTDTHTEVVGIVEMPETQDQFLVLPTEALRGQSVCISWPQAWVSIRSPAPAPNRNRPSSLLPWFPQTCWSP